MKYVLSIVAVITAFMFFVPQAFATGPVLEVTAVTPVQSSATADGTFEHGWKWIFDVTVPDNEVLVQMKFANWTNASNTIPADNTRFYSDQSLDATSTSPISISAPDVYSTPLHLDTNVDLDPVKAGRQIHIAVEVKIPVGTPNGSYSTSYGIISLPEPPKPIITLLGAITTDASKVYDGTTTASSTVCHIASGILSGDDVSCKVDSADFDTRHAGILKVVTAQISLDGVDKDKYTVNPTATTSADITPRPITVTAVPNEKVYDGTNSASSTPLITEGSLTPGDVSMYYEVYLDAEIGTGKLLLPMGYIEDGNRNDNYNATIATSTEGIIDAP